MTDLAALKSETLAAIAAAPDEAALEAARVAALGKKGSISAAAGDVGQNVARRAQKRRRGDQRAQRRGDRSSRRAARRAEGGGAGEPARRPKRSTSRCRCARRAIDAGRIHPISQVLDEVTAIFAEMGFAIAEGPDIESDDYNFTKLNFPPGHPAREMHDTFFFAPSGTNERKLLRTHTSPVQVRTMLSQKPPIRIICPGRTYRTDFDQTHTPMFHQVEGLVIDKSANLGNLKWVLEEFCKAFFEVPHVGMRFRPSFFPFTSPSMEVDIQCRRSGGEIRFGEGEDWLEILGCGMVHANVLRNCGIDPDEFQGFAWGMGLDRIAMLKYGLPDLARPVRRGFALDRPLRVPAARYSDAGGGIERVGVTTLLDPIA